MGRPVRLAAIVTGSGRRLHVRPGSGYVDIAAASGDPRLSSLRPFLEAGVVALDTAGR
jgi:hypothetical protein